MWRSLHITLQFELTFSCLENLLSASIKDEKMPTIEPSKGYLYTQKHIHTYIHIDTHADHYPVNILHCTVPLFWCMIVVYVPQHHRGLCKGHKHSTFPFRFHFDIFTISQVPISLEYIYIYIYTPFSINSLVSTFRCNHEIIPKHIQTKAWI